MAETTSSSPINPSPSPSPSPSSSSPQHTPTPTPSSLFPISSTTAIINTSSTTSSQWQSSSSFNTDVSIINNAVYSSTFQQQSEPIQEPPSSTSYGFLDSSESDKEKEKKKKSKKKKKRKREKVKIDDEFVAYGVRKSGVRAWANSDTTKPTKDYYFDSRGDPNNLAFGCLYRMDIGRYKLYDVPKSSRISFRWYSRLIDRSLLTREEVDEEGSDAKLKSHGRYWSAKHSVIEYHRNFKRIRIVARGKHVQVSCNDFIPLSDEDGDASLLSRASVIVESWEDEVLRKTREFNKMTREHPHNVRIWMDFADFQDKIANKQPQKGARLQLLEKKISILEKAVELHPENEELLVSLLKAYHSRDSADVFIGRWEKVLMKHTGSVKLWQEFLRVVKGDFSTCKVSVLRKMYAHAIQALYTACSKRHRQVHRASEQPSPEIVDTVCEKDIVDIFLCLCRFEWQAGYHELATALLQAEIEYSLFCPPLQLTEQSKKRLFEHFWNSNGARVGEDGAIGWSSWLEKEEENRQKLMHEMAVKEDNQGGWTGWSVPLSKGAEDLANLEKDILTDVVMEEMEEEDVKQDEHDATLLRMLGIDVDAEANREVHDTKTWVRWSEEELSRDYDQWMPVRVNSGVSLTKDVMENDEEQLSRVILFEDVNDYLFSLSSADARLSLVLQFIDFFGGDISHWFCTNSAYWDEKMLSSEMLPKSIARYFESATGPTKLESGSGTLSVEFLLQQSENIVRTEMMKFLRNASLLCLRVFPRNYKIEEVILISEEQSFVVPNASQHATPSQPLAKHLLKSDRQDVLLCGVYARREAAYGNIDYARKVFDMALSSITGLPMETQSMAAPLLYLWYSEMELADGCIGELESTHRALHILSCLGSGIIYTPYERRPSSTQLLRAHQGFKEHINTIRSSWARHGIDESSIALICSAALFGELTAGWIAGIEVISDALSMVLPEKKSRSYQLEFLFNYQVRMLKKHHQPVTLSKVLQYVSAGFQVYPSNPELFCCLVHLGHLYTVPNKLRQIFDDLFQKIIVNCVGQPTRSRGSFTEEGFQGEIDGKPSVMLWLFSLSYELSRGAPQHRIHGLFERALVNDRLHSSVVLWRYYISYEIHICNFSAARRVFFRAIHACPWSKMLWLDGFQKLHTIITAKELLDLQEVMRHKELNLRTDIYEILLQDEFNHC